MTKLEKVIKGLECYSEWDSIDEYLGNGLCPQRCEECPYNDSDVDNCQKSLAKDAIALLKEQEALTPKVSMSGLWYECPACGRHLTKDIDHYCARCGRAVKWE